MSGVAYLDTSAFVKLVVREPGSAALRRALAGHGRFAASRLMAAEAARAIRRTGNGAAMERLPAVLRGVALVEVDAELLRAAAVLDPPELRTLDAIHLATALALGGDLAALYTYDDRLADAALAIGLPVASPR